MSVRIYRVFYSFTFYCKATGKKLKANSSTLYSARRYRNEILMDKNYERVSDIFEDRLER